VEDTAAELFAEAQARAREQAAYEQLKASGMCYLLYCVTFLKVLNFTFLASAKMLQNFMFCPTVRGILYPVKPFVATTQISRYSCEVVASERW